MSVKRDHEPVGFSLMRFGVRQPSYRDLRAAISALFGYGLPFIGALLLIKVIVNSYGSSAFGLYTFAFGVAVAVRIAVFNVAQPVLIRFFQEAMENGDSRNLIRNFCYVTGFIGLIGLVLYISVSGQADSCASLGGGKCTISYIGVGLILGAGLGGSSVIAELDNAMANRQRGTVFLCMIPAIQILIVAVFKALDYNIQSCILASSISLILLTVLNSYLLLRSASNISIIEGFSRREFHQRMIGFAAGLTLWIVPTLITKTSDRLLFSAYLSARELASYAICVTLTQNVFGAINTILTRYFNPTIFGSLNDSGEDRSVDSHNAVDRMSKIVLALGFGVVIVYFFSANLILRIIADSTVAKAGWLLPLIGFAAIFQAAADVQALHGQIKRRTRPFFYARSVAAVALFALAFILIPRYGLLGAGLTTSATFMIGAAANYCAARFIKRSYIRSL